MRGLLPCPFCGKQVAIIDTCHELEDCANFERCGDGGYYSVVCNFNHGGCGGSAGYDRTELGAISRWNRRTDAVPVVRGEWSQRSCFDEDENVYVCSVCDEPWTLIAGTPLENNMHHCPNCGVKMEAGEGE